MKAKREPRKVHIGSKVPPAIKKAIKKIAARDDRTDSQIICRLLSNCPEIQAELPAARTQV